MAPEQTDREQQVADALTALVVIHKTAMEYNERVTQVLEQNAHISNQLSELQMMHKTTQDSVQQLLEWRNKRQAVTDFLVWVLEKSPVIGALLVFVFWAASNFPKGTK